MFINEQENSQEHFFKVASSYLKSQEVFSYFEDGKVKIDLRFFGNMYSISFWLEPLTSICHWQCLMRDAFPYDKRYDVLRVVDAICQKFSICGRMFCEDGHTCNLESTGSVDVADHAIDEDLIHEIISKILPQFHILATGARNCPALPLTADSFAEIFGSDEGDHSLDPRRN